MSSSLSSLERIGGFICSHNRFSWESIESSKNKWCGVTSHVTLKPFFFAFSTSLSPSRVEKWQSFPCSPYSSTKCNANSVAETSASAGLLCSCVSRDLLSSNSRGSSQWKLTLCPRYLFIVSSSCSWEVKNKSPTDGPM